MTNFIKKYVFFLVDDETKNEIRNRVKTADHRGFQVAVILISMFQLFMLLLNFIRKGWGWSDYTIPYRILYIALMLSSIVFCLALEIMYRKKTSSLPFFLVVMLYVYIVFAWGVGISVLDSYNYPILVTFSYVVITTAAFVTVEPWAYIGGASIATIALNITLVVDTNAHWSQAALINSVSVLLLASMVSIFTFYRRVNAFFLELEVQGLNNELEAKAYVDDLTKLYNRRYLSECMNEELDYSINGSGIILFDIDNFKNVNDTYGHLVGDQVLHTVGQITLDSKAYSYCVRYGGEEIMIFFKNISSEQLYSISEELRKNIEAKDIIIDDNVHLHVTVSLGLAKAKDNVKYNTLINQADDALYRAKKNGKNQTVWY